MLILIMLGLVSRTALIFLTLIREGNDFFGTPRILTLISDSWLLLIILWLAYVITLGSIVASIGWYGTVIVFLLHCFLYQDLGLVLAALVLHAIGGDKNE